MLDGVIAECIQQIGCVGLVHLQEHLTDSTLDPFPTRLLLANLVQQSH